jgi:transglutaminase-like putative cysteine protease
VSLKYNQFLFSRAFWLFSLILVIVLLFLTGLSFSVRGGLTRLFLAAGLSGAVAAYAISFTRLKNCQAGVLLTISGFLGLLFYIARLVELLPQLINTFIILRIQINTWVINRTPLPDFQPVEIILTEVIERLMTLFARVLDWLSKVIMGSVINDPVARAFTWSLAVFALSAWAGWVMSRYRNPLAAFTPMVALLAIVADYTGIGFIPLWLMLAGVLILMGITRYDSNRVRWQRNKVDFSESIPIDTGMAVAILTTALAALAWIMPSFSVRAMAETIRNWGSSQNELAETFGLQPAPASPSNFAPYISPQGLPRSHLVGSGPELSRQFVMTIRTGELLPQPPISNSPPVPRHYWRSLTYDIYTGSRWLSSPVEVNSYKAGQPLYEIHPEGYHVVTQEITLLRDLGGQLHWTGQLVSVNQDYEAAWRYRPDNLTQPDPFAGMDLLGAVSPAESYTATSLESAVTQYDLRSSVGPYPPSIARFVSLPDSVPERVLSLARELTAISSTPYDRAQAIETYLRTNYPYTLDVPAPPIGRDVADYFLFDLKKGYCDYYATAMVVLARAAGLPARFVIGYAGGTYDSSNAQYIISEANAHSWVEIFFTDIGWVEFEPTAGLPAINRQDEPLLQSTNAFPLDKNDKSTDFVLIKTLLNFLAKLGIGIFLVGSISIATLWIESVILFLQPVTLSLTKIFKRMEKLGSRVAGNETGETPYEYSDRLKSRMNSIRTQRGSETRSVIEEIELITDSYVLSSFSKNPIDRNQVSLVIHSWRRLHLRLLIEIFLLSIGFRKGPF